MARTKSPSKSTPTPALTTDQALAHITPDLRGLAVPLDALTPDPRNARKHGSRNLAAVCDSLKAFGQVKPLVGRRVTDPATGAVSTVVVAGNGTLQAARMLGLTFLAVTIRDMDERTAQAYAIADNRTAELAEWDEELLGQILAELVDAESGVLAPGLENAWDDESLEALLQADEPAVTEEFSEDTRDKTPEEYEPRLDASTGAVIRQILVLLSPEDYAKAQETIEQLKQKHGLTTTSEVFMWLVRTAGV